MATSEEARNGCQRPVSVDEVAAFHANGWVFLPQIVSSDFVVKLAVVIDSAVESGQLADLSRMRSDLGGGVQVPVTDRETGPRGRFLAGTDHWLTDDRFAELARSPVLSTIAASLFETERVGLYEDSVLVKEPRSEESTRWHQDLAYFNIEGNQVCTMWIPVDSVSPHKGGLRFVRGSHLDRPMFKPTLFVTDDSLPGTRGEEISSLDLTGAQIDEPSYAIGDLSVHHGRTLHSAGSNADPNLARRAYSVRYYGPDARFAPRGGVMGKPWQAGLTPGSPLPTDLGATNL